MACLKGGLGYTEGVHLSLPSLGSETCRLWLPTAHIQAYVTHTLVAVRRVLAYVVRRHYTATVRSGCQLVQV